MKLLLEVHTIILTTNDLEIQFAYGVTINLSNREKVICYQLEFGK